MLALCYGMNAALTAIRQVQAIVLVLSGSLAELEQVEEKDGSPLINELLVRTGQEGCWVHCWRRQPVISWVDCLLGERHV